MANLTRDDLRNRINSDPGTRQELIDFHVANRPWAAGTTDYQRKQRLEWEMNIPAYANVLIGQFLPEYNSAHTNWFERRLQNIPHIPHPNIHIGNRAGRALGVGAATVGAGLVGLVASALIDNEAGAEAVSIASQTALWMSPVTTMLAYASNFVNDTGRKRMRDIGIAASIGVLGLLSRQLVDDDTIKKTVELGSYTALGAAAAGTLVDMVKYRR